MKERIQRNSVLHIVIEIHKRGNCAVFNPDHFIDLGLKFGFKLIKDGRFLTLDSSQLKLF